MSRLLTGAVMAAVTLATPLAQTPTFRGGVDLVQLGVTVSDRQGAYVTDLTADDFVVLENGKPQRIAYFAPGGESSTAPEMHVGLLFDTSGSMTDDIALSR